MTDNPEFAAAREKLLTDIRAHLDRCRRQDMTRQAARAVVWADLLRQLDECLAEDAMPPDVTEERRRELIPIVQEALDAAFE